MSLLRIAATLAVIGVLLFDAGAVAVNHVQVDELAQSALRAAVGSAQTPDGRRPDTIAAAAQSGLSRNGRARLESAILDVTGLTVVVSLDAKVLLLDRLGPLADLATTSVRKTAEAG